NLVEKAPEANLPAMLVAKLLNFCENLSVRKWSDSEIVEDIEFLKAQLQENFQSLTDNMVLAVAAHDLGQYVKYYPDGK
ncbi:4122_t:CDS:2, partial [Racocetra fulgida]